MLPTATHPESVPFLLARRAAPDASSDAEVDLSEDFETERTVPASKSVPPRPPPARANIAESELPSVIVDLRELQASEEEEAQRASDVDGLLAETEVLEAVSIERARRERRQKTHANIERRSTGRSRGFAIAMLAAAIAAGGTFAGMRGHHVLARSLGAALHLSH